MRAASLVVTVCLSAAALCAAEWTPKAQTSDSSAAAFRPELFAGLWDYNAEESVNIATGRPEQNPRGAPIRPPAQRRAASARGGESQVDRDSLFPPSPEMLRENREMSRDLLEVPETLRVAVSSDAVSITDDLGRQLTFPTDGSRSRYRLSASQFSARVRWEGERLVKDVEGDYGFRMSEVYFLSPDRNRMFVIVRVREPRQGRVVAGFDRVYDRVDLENP
jgi:hypothetical protein